MVSFCELNYHYGNNGKSEPRPGVAWNHENQGIVYTWSDDWGKTWVKTRKVDQRPFATKPPVGSPHGRIVTLADGTSLMSVYGKCDPAPAARFGIPAGTGTMSGVFRSTDNGETWGDPSIIMTKKGTLAWDARDANSGYANGARAGDGSIVVVYYAMGPNSNYRNLWAKSKVFAVRFTEDQLLAEVARRFPARSEVALAGKAISTEIDVRRYHTYTMRLTRADPERPDPRDLVELLVDGHKVGQAQRSQLPGDGMKHVLFGDNDSSSQSEVAATARGQDPIPKGHRPEGLRRSRRLDHDGRVPRRRPGQRGQREPARA